jgi:hypothetical protein
VKKDKPIGTKAFREAWKRHRPSRDTWGVEYVYDFGAFAIWKAAIRHERMRAARALGERK